MTLQADSYRLNPGNLVEFYVVDMEPIGGGVIRLHPGVNEFEQPVVWQGQTYSPFPLESEGYEKSSQGPVPRPRLRIANVGNEVNKAGEMGALALEWGDLVGCRVTKYVTLTKYIDAANFKNGNPTADPSQYFMPEIYFIDSKTHEDKNYIEFELAGATDLIGVRVPGGQINRTICTWNYRSEECGYTGPPVADKSDMPTTDPAQDRCGRRLSSCKLRYPQAMTPGSTVSLPCRIFPGAGQSQ